MTKLLVALTAAAVVLVGVAVSGWATAAGGPAWAPASTSPDRHQAAPPSTIALSRAARVTGVALRLDVALLRRTGSTVTLDLRLRSNAPHGGATFAVDDAFGVNADGDLSGVYLVDPATGRRIGPRFDGDDECVCTANGYELDVAPGGTTMLTATFGGLSPGSTTADVVVPHFGAFRDVPLR